MMEATRLSPSAVYSSIQNISGNLYIYHYATGTTHILNTVSQTQWVTAATPNYPQVSATFVGTGTLPVGECLIYTKGNLPFSGIIGDEVAYDATNKGIKFSNANLGARIGIISGATSAGNGLRISQSRSGSMIYLNGTASGTNGIFMDMDGTGDGITMQLDNAQIKNGIISTMNRTDSYLYNSETHGLKVDIKHNLDNPLIRGGYIRAFNGRTTTGTNPATVKGLEVRAGHGNASAISIGLDVVSESVSTITGRFVGASSQTADILQAHVGGVGVKFSITGTGEVVADNTIWLNSTKTVGIFRGTGTPEGVITASPGSTFHRTDGGASTSFYVKESGTGNTGWIAK